MQRRSSTGSSNDDGMNKYDSAQHLRRDEYSGGWPGDGWGVEGCGGPRIAEGATLDAASHESELHPIATCVRVAFLAANRHHLVHAIVCRLLLKILCCGGALPRWSARGPPRAQPRGGAFREEGMLVSSDGMGVRLDVLVRDPHRRAIPRIRRELTVRHLPEQYHLLE